MPMRLLLALKFYCSIYTLSTILCDVSSQSTHTLWNTGSTAEQKIESKWSVSHHRRAAGWLVWIKRVIENEPPVRQSFCTANTLKNKNPHDGFISCLTFDFGQCKKNRPPSVGFWGDFTIEIEFICTRPIFTIKSELGGKACMGGRFWRQFYFYDATRHHHTTGQTSHMVW